MSDGTTTPGSSAGFEDERKGAEVAAPLTGTLHERADGFGVTGEDKLVTRLVEEAERRVRPPATGGSGPVATSPAVRPAVHAYFLAHSPLAEVLGGRSAPAVGIDDIFDGSPMSATQALTNLNRWFLRPGLTETDVINLIRGPLAQIVEDSERNDPDALEARADLLVAALRPIERSPRIEVLVWRLAAVTEKAISGWGMVSTLNTISSLFDRQPYSDMVPSFVLTYRVLVRVLGSLEDGGMRPVRGETLSTLAANTGIGINQAAQERGVALIEGQAATFVLNLLRISALMTENDIDEHTERALWRTVGLDLPVGSLAIVSEMAAGNRSLEANWGATGTATFQLLNVMAHAMRGNTGRVTSNLFNVGVTLLNSQDTPDPLTALDRMTLNATGAWVALATAISPLDAVASSGLISCLVNFAGTFTQWRRRGARDQAPALAVATEIGRLARWEPLRQVDDPRVAEDVGRLQVVGRQFEDAQAFDIDRLAAGLVAFLAQRDMPVVAPASEEVPLVGMWQGDDEAVIEWLTSVLGTLLGSVVGADQEALAVVVQEVLDIGAHKSAEATAIEAVIEIWRGVRGTPLEDHVSRVIPPDRIREVEARLGADADDVGSLADAMRLVTPEPDESDE